MNGLTIVLIAFGLAMDAFAVSITNGITAKKMKLRNALAPAISFGLFQAFMPVIGWLAGLTLIQFIAGIDHWIAFGLLSFIGCKMIYESTKIGAEKENFELTNPYVLLMLSIATSIDALAVGLSFAFLKISIVAPVLIIGLITFILSFCGAYIGNKIGHFCENKIEILGGLVLIGIGLKILIEHLLQ